MSTTTRASVNGIATSIAQIPLELLKAELLRRQQEEEGDKSGVPTSSASPAATSTSKPECGTKGTQASYDVGSHVFALVLILILSTASCAFPILARRFPKLPIPHHFLFLSRHFGTGVLIATAFVHLLPTAFHSLSDPCLPDFWIKGYVAMPGLVAMIAVFAVVGIEMFFASQGAGHVHGSGFDTIPSHEAEVPGAGDVRFGGKKDRTLGRGSRPRAFSDRDAAFDNDAEEENNRDLGMNEIDKLHEEEQEGWNAAAATQNGSAHSKLPATDPDASDSEGDLELELDELDPNTTNMEDDADLLAGRDPSSRRNRPSHNRNASARSAHSATSTSGPPPSPQLARRLLLQCALLEAGILFHSVFIGMAVSVSRGSAFVVLLIAIAFHQTFEGLALGARISAIVPLLPARSPRPWLMTLAYGTTTPIGQAIGLAIHGLYDPKSEVGLILVGCMNAISSGLLLFAGLVELLAEDFLSEGSYKILKGRRRLEACACVLLGAFLMALIGAWA